MARFSYLETRRTSAPVPRKMGVREAPVNTAGDEWWPAATGSGRKAPQGCRARYNGFSAPINPSFEDNVMTTDSARDKLVDEFSSVLSEAESLLDKASKETGDRARDLRSQVEARLLSAKLKLQELEGEAVDRAKAAARYTDDYVHDHPWQAIGIAAGVGLAIGLLMNRR